jgi:hypothetical protein
MRVMLVLVVIERTKVVDDACAALDLMPQANSPRNEHGCYYCAPPHDCVFLAIKRFRRNEFSAHLFIILRLLARDSTTGPFSRKPYSRTPGV